MHPKPADPPKLLDQVRQACRLRHYSPRTEDAYCLWIRRFVLFHDKQHPCALGHADVTAFLSSLLAQLTGIPALVASLLYGSGLRLLECLELRVKDIDFESRQLTVRQGKGRKDRVTMLPLSTVPLLSEHLNNVRMLHQADLQRGLGRVVLPHSLALKYPNADQSWAWQFVFPAGRICRDPRWGDPTRFHVHESVIQRAVTNAVRRSGIAKRASCHTFRVGGQEDLEQRLRNGDLSDVPRDAGDAEQLLRAVKE